MSATVDIVHMHHALALAERGIGRVAPNPAVGCVIVDVDGHIVGRGWTQPGGRPHAETEALTMAGTAAQGATAYVTLEPCSHYGQTPPCADALIAAGVARVVAACVDPDPRVSGRGLQRLREAGIEVEFGVLEVEARALNAGFFKRVLHGRPLVALKSAESSDGYVAGPPHGPRWITGEAARRYAHLLRTKYDAILVGIGTVLADDPLLTCRLPGLESRSPLRVVLDTYLRLPHASQLARTAREHHTLLFAASDRKDTALLSAGIEIERAPADAKERPAFNHVLEALAKRGVTRVLAEGGPAVHAELLRLGLVDEIHLFLAPHALSGGLRSAITRPPAGFRLVAREDISPDILESYEATG